MKWLRSEGGKFTSAIDLWFLVFGDFTLLLSAAADEANRKLCGFAITRYKICCFFLVVICNVRLRQIEDFLSGFDT